MNAIQKSLDVLRHYYADRDGNIYPLNDVQIAVYIDALAAVPSHDLERGVRVWMKTNKWFPKVSELLDAVCPEPDLAECALIAWSAVEIAARRFHACDSVSFADIDVAEAVRRTFGSWRSVISTEHDGPQWAMKRQSFLANYKAAAREILPTDDESMRVGKYTSGYLHGFVEFIAGLPELDWQKIRSGQPSLTAGDTHKALQP